MLEYFTKEAIPMFLNNTYMKKRKLWIIIILCTVLLTVLLAVLIHPRLYWLNDDRLLAKLTELGCDFSDSNLDADFYSRLRQTVLYFEKYPDHIDMITSYSLNAEQRMAVRAAARKYYYLKPLNEPE